MAKTVTRYVCQSCGTVHRKWAGKCDGCGEWNSIVEEVEEKAPVGSGGRAAGKGRALEFASLAGASDGPKRTTAGIAEMDRVLGCGLVPGSAVLRSTTSGREPVRAAASAICRTAPRT